jgi:Leucine-rich repeat (LRR) protein
MSLPAVSCNCQVLFFELTFLIFRVDAKPLLSPTQLAVLVLTNNKLVGSIPTSIGYLTKLEVVGLNQNSLSGVVPSSLCAATHLTLMNAESNRLTCYPACLSTVQSKSFDAGTGMCSSGRLGVMLYISLPYTFYLINTNIPRLLFSDMT